ncbi:MAG: DUF6788 family protein [Acidobacteriota bacterium]
MRRHLLSAEERQVRSRLLQLCSEHWLMRASLSERPRTCGKPNCRCARGQLHQSLYVVQSRLGKPRQLFVPKTWEERVRQAVQDYQQLQRLLEEVSELEWGHLERREP